MQDEAVLAAVLAHEIAHVTQLHIVKRLNIQGKDASPEAGVARFFGGTGGTARVAFNQAVDKAIDLLFSEGLDHADEYEADEVGSLLLTHTGYDAQALSRYLQRVSAVKAGQGAVLVKTHPRFAERLTRLDSLAAREGLAGLRYPRVEQRFVQHVKFD
jgi:predicted Zn-dependent protease